MYNHILNTFTVSLTSTLCFQWRRNEILAKNKQMNLIKAEREYSSSDLHAEKSSITQWRWEFKLG